MSDPVRFGERLRGRFVDAAAESMASEECPEAEWIRLAATGQVPFSELERLLHHAASCGACTVAWRLAREGASPSETPVPAARHRRWTFAVAAVVVAAIGVVVFRPSPREADDDRLRATGTALLRSSIPDASELPRSAFRLRWTPGPGGTRYAIVVTDERLVTVAEGVDLAVPEFVVPEAALSSIPAGTRVLWQVRADLPDGTRVASSTFVARVAEGGAP